MITLNNSKLDNIPEAMDEDVVMDPTHPIQSVPQGDPPTSTPHAMEPLLQAPLLPPPGPSPNGNQPHPTVHAQLPSNWSPFFQPSSRPEQTTPERSTSQPPMQAQPTGQTTVHPTESAFQQKSQRKKKATNTDPPPPVVEDSDNEGPSSKKRKKGDPNGEAPPQPAKARLGRAASVPSVPSTSFFVPQLPTAVRQASANRRSGTAQNLSELAPLPEYKPVPENPLFNQGVFDRHILMKVYEDQAALRRQLTALHQDLSKQHETNQARTSGGSGTSGGAGSGQGNPRRDDKSDDSEGGESDAGTGKPRGRHHWERPENCTKEAWNSLMSDVRDHLLSLLRIESTEPDQLLRLRPKLSAQEIQALKWNLDGECWTEQTLRLDFSQPWSFGPNKSAARIFIASFLRAVKAGSFKVKDDLLTPHIIEGRFVQFFTYLKTPVLVSHKLRTPRPATSASRRAQNTRRKTLLDRRRDACLSRKGLQHHLTLLEKLKPEHMSDDETDDEGPPKTFKIINTRWRSQQFTQLLRDLDEVYNENRRNPHRSLTQTASGKPRGNSPRQRQDYKNAWADGSAPAGLPRGCYDSGWFQQQPKWVRDGLRIKKGDYNFHVEMEELRPQNGKNKGKQVNRLGQK